MKMCRVRNEKRDRGQTDLEAGLKMGKSVRMHSNVLQKTDGATWEQLFVLLSD